MAKPYNELTVEEKQRSKDAAKKYYHSNKEKCAKRLKNWRQANADYVREKQRLDKRKRKLDAIKYLGSLCYVCNGDFHPAIFEFHHTNPEDKDRDPSKMLQLSWKRITNELDKCILLCANCHRLEHHKDNY